MSITVSGALIKQFYADPVFWPETRYQDDTLIFINGVNVDESGLDPVTAPDDAVVRLEYGYVIDNDVEGFGSKDLLAYFESWRQAQAPTAPVRLVVECPAAALDAVKTALAAAGATVLA